MNTSVFWVVTPCSPVKVHWRFGGTYLLNTRDRRINQARNQQKADNKQLQAICSSETPVDFKLVTRHYILEDRTLHAHGCVDFKSNTVCSAVLSVCFMLVSCLVYTSTFKMEALFNFETSVDIYRNTGRYVPEDRTLQVRKLVQNLAILVHSLRFV
jgi:hypothetical protein